MTWAPSGRVVRKGSHSAATGYDRRFLFGGWSGIVVVPTTYEETLERALGKIGEPYLIVERAGVHELLDGDLAALDGSVGGSDRIVGYLPACRLEHLGDRAFLHDAPAPLSVHVGGDGQRDRLGRDRRGDGPGRDSRDLRRGRAVARRGRGGDRSARARAWAIAPLRHEPDPQPGRARTWRSAVVDLYLRRGVRLVEASAFLEPDAAGGPLSRGGHPPRRLGPDRRAQSDHRQGLAGRGRVQVHGAAAGAVPARAGRRRRDHRRAGRVGRADPDGRRHHGRGRFRRPYRQPAGDRRCCRRCWPCATGCRRSTATSRRSASARPAASRRRGRRPPPSRWGRPTS